MNFIQKISGLKLAGWLGAGLLLIGIMNALHESASAVTVDDFWRGTAHFEQVGEIDWVTAPHGNTAESSSWFSVRSNIWYAFNRVGIPDSQAGCPSTHMRIVVRESRDQGRNWSGPEVAAEPGDSVNGDGCAILDGSAFFDDMTGTWHLLAQCSDVGNQGGWAMCHYSRKNQSPKGRFAPDPGNPVVKGGSLWARLCNGAQSPCPATTVDEGTPEIVAKERGRFLVTFHGYDYASKTALRGMAYTPDFQRWNVKGGGLPDGPLLGPAECVRHTPHCVGVGQASTLFTQKYVYVLAESMDKSLECLPGQQWLFYLHRAPKGEFPRSGSKLWETYAGSPLLTPSSNDPQTTCKVTYARWIRDGSSTYIVYEDRITKSIYLKRRLLKLMPGGGVPIRLM
ncbi:hypothetical protein [Sphingobium yanoikuyae]|uniref:hypothetical protein n=1 Tax=Sphingobium yanoikuyae TaxID=13690 RepID=UPI003F0D3D7A